MKPQLVIFAWMGTSVLIGILFNSIERRVLSPYAKINQFPPYEELRKFKRVCTVSMTVWILMTTVSCCLVIWRWNIPGPWGEALLPTFGLTFGGVAQLYFTRLPKGTWVFKVASYALSSDIRLTPLQQFISIEMSRKAEYRVCCAYAMQEKGDVVTLGNAYREAFSLLKKMSPDISRWNNNLISDQELFLKSIIFEAEDILERIWNDRASNKQRGDLAAVELLSLPISSGGQVSVLLRILQEIHEESKDPQWIIETSIKKGVFLHDPFRDTFIKEYLGKEWPCQDMEF